MNLKNFTFFSKSLFLLSFLAICSVQMNAQPEMTIWRVDQAHLDDPNQGTALEWDCGYEYYITYADENSSIDVILEIKNEGDANLVLNSTPSFAAGGSSEFSIVTPPAKLNLAPGEETHFVVRYSAPSSYNNASAILELESNDPTNGSCNFNFDVGFIAVSVNPLELTCDGTPTTSPADIGDAVVGNSTSKTFTLTNPSVNTFDASLISCSGLSDLITISGADAADFSVTAAPSSSIAVGGTTDFIIEFTPSSPGPKTASLCYDFSFFAVVGSGTNVVLNGNGLPAADPIPTMSEWGLMIFGLLVLNLGVFFLYKREALLKF